MLPKEYKNNANACSWTCAAGEGKKTAFETCCDIELEENLLTVSTVEQKPPLWARSETM